MQYPEKLFTVAVRVRPLFEKEIQNEDHICIELEDKAVTIINDKKTRKFDVDYVFNEKTKQEQVYNTCCSQMIKKFVEGESGIILTYGETGAGKRFTMVGNCQSSKLKQKGIIPHAIEEIFQRIDPKHQKVFCNSYHLYNQNLYDLLSQDYEKYRQIKQNQEGTYIPDLTQISATSALELFIHLQQAQLNQKRMTTKSCSLGRHISCFFKIKIQTQSQDTLEKAKNAQLLFVKLASSDRIKNSQQAKYQRGQLQSIIGFERVIGALNIEQSPKYVPYRNCKLTRLLMNAFKSNTKFLMFANISPSSSHMPSTFRTLMLATRAMSAKINHLPAKDSKQSGEHQNVKEESKQYKENVGSGSNLIVQSEQKQYLKAGSFEKQEKSQTNFSSQKHSNIKQLLNKLKADLEYRKANLYGK